MNFKKAQAALESLIIIGFIVLLSIPIIFYFFLYSGEKLAQVADFQIESILGQIVDSATEVWYQGEGSSKIITLYIPPGITNIYFGGDSQIILPNQVITYNPTKEVIIYYESYGQQKQFIKYSPAFIKNYPLDRTPPPKASVNYRPPNSDSKYLPSGLIILKLSYQRQPKYQIQGAQPPFFPDDYILIERLNK
jgi:uncharacterized protein (UPF0333 family)